LILICNDADSVFMMIMRNDGRYLQRDYRYHNN
jgi:hypothetical protein